LAIKLVQRFVKCNTILEISFNSTSQVVEVTDPADEWLNQHKIEFRKVKYFKH